MNEMGFKKREFRFGGIIKGLLIRLNVVEIGVLVIFF